MRIDRLGEFAAVLRDLEQDPAELAVAIEESGLPGLVETVASYETVGVYFNEEFDLGSLHRNFGSSAEASTHTVHVVPVCYEMGEDLEEAARTLGLRSDEVIALHTGREYRCYAIGFCPGFPYLGYLPERLCGVPRRSEPRVRIEPGSVAITGRQTGIYPLPRPGGWAILGRTPVVITDVEARFFPIRVGDRVRFESIGPEEFEARRGERL